MGSAYLALASAAPIAITPFRSDDIINHTVKARFDASGLSFFSYIHQWIGPWISREGRFFPGSATWTFAVFSAFPSRGPYKIFLAALCLLMIALTVALVATLTRSAVGPVVVVALASTLTLRTWFDGLDSFSGVLPLTVCLTVGSCVLLLTGKGWASAVLASCLWGFALLTYEVAILLTPSLCIAVWWMRRRWTRTLPLIIPSGVIALVVSVLRARAHGSVGNAYTVSLDPVRVLATYVKQATAALPLSAQWFPGAAELRVDPALIVLMVVLIGVPAAIVLTLVSRTPVRVSRPALGVAALVGASLWLLPPLLVAVSLGWQHELPRGQGYVSVVWGYVGVAVVATVGWISLAQAAAPAMRLPTEAGLACRPRRIVLHIATAALALVCALTVAQSATIAESLHATGVARFGNSSSAPGA